MELCGACLLTTQHPHEFVLAACLATRTVAHYTRKLEVNPLSFLNVDIYLVVYAAVIRAMRAAFLLFFSCDLLGLIISNLLFGFNLFTIDGINEAFTPMDSQMIEMLH